MNDTPRNHQKKLQSEIASDEIRTDDLIKATQVEADQKRESLRDINVTNNNYWRFKGEERSSLPKGIKLGIAVLVVLFIAGSIFSIYMIKKNIAATVSSQIDTLQTGVQDLQNLDPGSAQQKFASLGNMSSPSGFFGMIASFFEGSTGAVHSITDLSQQLAALAGNINNAEADIFTFISPSSGTGSGFIADLNNIKTSLIAIDNDTNQLSGTAAYFGSGAAMTGGGYLSLKTQVESAINFLNAFIPWLSDPSATHHILVLLQNPSEMRPGGGFLGSYADVSIASGTITNIAIHDIADVDKKFTEKIVPPTPLQLEGMAFRPADGNWSFDFPTSASETVSLFEGSGLYANTSTTFDGVVAVTPQILSDLLSVTGPISVSSTTFNSDNLMVQIQKMVQAGQARSASGLPTYPKIILQNLWQSIFEKVASSSDTEKGQMLNLAMGWISNKDLMIYFKDPTFQSFAKQYGMTGAVYQLPQNVNADYLAVVNTDVNSDKSELYMAQTVTYNATINTDGTLSDHVTIDRKHNGKQSPYWWYQTTNQDYMQVFVPAGASLTNASGGIVKNVPAPINYARQGYSTDPLIASLQSDLQKSFTFPSVTSHSELGKQVFAVWLRTYAGSSSEVSFDYSQHLYSLPADGVQYQFVFERQSGASSNSKLEIDAPLGYVFAENGLASFTYESTSSSASMPGSMVVNLTLQKLQ